MYPHILAQLSLLFPLAHTKVCLMGNEEVKIVIEHTYIGLTFSSSNNIFLKHYEKKKPSQLNMLGILSLALMTL